MRKFEAEVEERVGARMGTNMGLWELKDLVMADGVEAGGLEARARWRKIGRMFRAWEEERRVEKLPHRERYYAIKREDEVGASVGERMRRWRKGTRAKRGFGRSKEKLQLTSGERGKLEEAAAEEIEKMRAGDVTWEYSPGEMPAPAAVVERAVEVAEAMEERPMVMYKEMVNGAWRRMLRVGFGKLRTQGEREMHKRRPEVATALRLEATKPTYEPKTRVINGFRYELTYESFEWFCEHVVQVRYKNPEATAEVKAQSALRGPLKLNSVQRKFAKWAIERLRTRKPVLVIILKARQQGFTTVIGALFLFLAHVFDGYGEIVLGPTRDDVQIITDDTYDVMLSSSDPAMVLKSKRQAQPLAVTWENASRLLIKSAGRKASARKVARGSMNHAVHASEYATWSDPRDSMQAVLNSLSDGPYSMQIIESTPNGISGRGAEFYHLWIRSRSGETGFYPWFSPWYEFEHYKLRPPEGWLVAFAKLRVKWNDEVAAPWNITPDDVRRHEYGIVPRDGADPVKLTLEQVYWRIEKKRTKCDNDENRFITEYPENEYTCFTSSGNAVLEGNIRELAMEMRKQSVGGERLTAASVPDANGMKYEFGPNGDVEVWKRPEVGHRYAIGVDVADRGKTRSAIFVIDRDTGEHVAEWMGTGVPQPEVAEIVERLGHLYNLAYVGPERTGVGASICDHLHHVLGYPNLYMFRPKTKMGDSAPTRPGWFTSGESKAIMGKNLQLAFRTGFLKSKSAFFLDQALTWEKAETGGYQTSRSAEGNFDLLMAGLIALSIHFEAEPMGFAKPSEQAAPVVETQEVTRPWYETRAGVERHERQAAVQRSFSVAPWDDY